MIILINDNKHKEGVIIFSIFNSMGFMLGKVTEQMIEKCNKELATCQIDAKEYGILTVIISMAESTQQQVGEVLRIDRTSMVKKVDHLESLGYILRIKNATDRRTYNLKLTDAGEQILNEFWPIMLNCERNVLSPLTDEEVLNLKIVFTKLIKARK